MRIVIEMQGAQSSGSWNRGVGRYTLSLALAMVHQAREQRHEVYLALNGEFADSVERIREAFRDVLPQEHIRVWRMPTPVAGISSENDGRRQTGELVREAFLLSLKPDIVLVSSLFEGLVDNAVTSLRVLSTRCLTAVILYDLIPLIHRKPYLENPAVAAWYMDKIKHLQRADLLLSISDSSSQEGVRYLGLPQDCCISISTAADSHFQAIAISLDEQVRLRKTYGLNGGFVMYTGGVDHRKNIEGLIRAYALLPSQLRSNYQLAIVCSVQDDSRARLQHLAAEAGLQKGELVLTGFVPEDDLIGLYNLCSVFVFPSWHEGFGLPALEAMCCGAPVIAANNSSLPEVVGWDEALFNPYSDESMVNAIQRVLTDTSFRTKLIEHGKQQATKFSWEYTAKRAIVAIERCVKAHATHNFVDAEKINRPRLAYVSPLPPERSGISDYSSELLPALAEHYEIEVVIEQDDITDKWINAHCAVRSVEWFLKNWKQFDRVLYHFGNSSFHQHMFELLEFIPGVVVLHDFYLSGVVHYMDATGYVSGYFARNLYESHGYYALADRSQFDDVAEVIWKYPCSRNVLSTSIGNIVHSQSSMKLASSWYQNDDPSHWSIVPLMRVSAQDVDKSKVRGQLGLGNDDFLVCSFGMIGPTKLNHRLLDVWLDSELSKTADCKLIFVGENHGGDYGLKLLEKIKNHPNGSSVEITGWVDQETFRNYLSIASLGVQLRTLSRGETSAAVLDCMNYSLATIVNANGSMADLEDDAVWKMSDEFEDADLKYALETLWRDKDIRNRYGKHAKSVIQTDHDPAMCAYQYKESIEHFYKKNQFTLDNSMMEIASSTSTWADERGLLRLAQDLAIAFPPKHRVKKFFVDVSELVHNDAESGGQRVMRSLLRQWLLNPPSEWRIEPVYAVQSGGYNYARLFTHNFLEISPCELGDEAIDPVPGDVFFALDLNHELNKMQSGFYQDLRQQGVAVKLMVYDVLSVTNPEFFIDYAPQVLADWLKTVS